MNHKLWWEKAGKKKGPEKVTLAQRFSNLSAPYDQQWRLKNSNAQTTYRSVKSSFLKVRIQASIYFKDSQVITMYNQV